MFRSAGANCCFSTTGSTGPFHWRQLCVPEESKYRYRRTAAKAQYNRVSLLQSVFVLQKSLFSLHSEQ